MISNTKITETVNEVGRMMGNGYNVLAEIVEKQNGMKMHGIVIRKENELSAPVIYLENVIKTEEDDTKLIASRICLQYHETTENGSSVQKKIEELMKNPEDVIENSTCVLLSKDRNREKFGKTVHGDGMCDLELFVKTWMDDEYATYLNPEYFIKNGYSETDVLGKVLSNTAKNKKAMLTPLSEAIFGGRRNLLKEDGFDFPEHEQFVFTTEDGYEGLVAMLYPDMLDRLSERLGSFVIIPLTIHDAILFRKDAFKDSEIEYLAESARAMTPEEGVEENEKLSGNSYWYDKTEKKVKIL